MAPWAESGSPPPGVSVEYWHKLLNRANSFFYDNARREGQSIPAEVAQVARRSGATRTRALEILQADEAKKAASLTEVGVSIQTLTINKKKVDHKMATPRAKGIAATMTKTMTDIGPNPGNVYPLTIDQYNRAEQLKAEGKSLLMTRSRELSIACKEEHNSTTLTCEPHGREIRSLLFAYMTNEGEGEWTTYRSPQFVAELKEMFLGNKFGTTAIQARYALEWRGYTRDRLCTPVFYDHSLRAALKIELAKMFEDPTISDAKILAYYEVESAKIVAQTSPFEQQFNARYSSCNTEVERAQLRRDWYCNPRETDTPAQSRLRVKWNELFDQGVPFEQIWNQAHADVANAKAAEKAILDKKREFEILSAAKAKKKQKKMDKRQSNHEDFMQKYTKMCSRSGCPNSCTPNADRTVTYPVCSICESLRDHGLVEREDAFTYCSKDCFEQDIQHHLQDAHKCIADSDAMLECVQQPKNGGSICAKCKQIGVVARFCSWDCHEKNRKGHVLLEHSKYGKVLREGGLLPRNEMIEYFKLQGYPEVEKAFNK